MLILAACVGFAQDARLTDLAARAATARDADRIEDALQLYGQALAIDPKWQEGLWNAGFLLYQADHYAEAIGPLRKLVELSPAAGPPVALLGLCEYELKQYDAALGHIQKGLAAGIEDDQQMTLVVKFHEALILNKKREFFAAFRKYAEFVPQEIRDEQVFLGAGLLAMHLAWIPAEIPAEKREMILSAGRAQVNWFHGDLTGAAKQFQELAGRYPEDPNVHYAYGYFLFGTDPDGAIAEWEKGIRLDPTQSEALAMLAWTYWLRDEHQKAYAHAQAAVAKDPNVALGQLVIGRYLVKTGQTQKGIEALERAARAEPINLEAHLALATAYSEAGRKKDSLRERELAMRIRGEMARGSH